MLCDFCHKNEAVFFIEQIGTNFRRKISICMDCAVKRGISPDPKAIERSVGTLFEELSKGKGRQEMDKVCPVCGQTLSAIQSTGRLGCPECYAIFRTELEKVMQQKKITGTYTGSMPRRLATFRSVLTDRVDLQAKLEESIRKEDYEKAAVYRDYLRALERSPVAGISDDSCIPPDKQAGTDHD